MRLKARGHDLLAAVRNIPSATMMLGCAGVSFIQRPLDTGVSHSAVQ